MQERRLRPGDVLDDYCPRERRITDHAVVAMIDDAIKQTRCVACDTEHEYKQARVPLRKKKAPAALFDQVLDGLQGSAVRAAQTPGRTTGTTPDTGPLSDVPDEPAAPLAASSALAADDLPADPGPPDEDSTHQDAQDTQPSPPVEDVPFRRSLIRAQLPKVEGQVPTRTLPDFTIRQPQNGRAVRPGGGGGRRRPGGDTSFQGPMRSGRTAHGDGGFGQGQGQGQGRGRGPGRGPAGAGARPERGGQTPHRGGRGRRGKKS